MDSEHTGEQQMTTTNPYQVLGVEEDATAAEIRTAYRKAALQNHPDKQESEEARAEASHKFARISNAYEILSDPEQKRQYDLQTNIQEEYQYDEDYHHAPPFHFHDPFQVFESVFREEFGQRNTAATPQRRDRMMDPFGNDPFFQSAFGSGSLFDDAFDSFFGPSRSSRRPHFRNYNDGDYNPHGLPQQRRRDEDEIAPRRHRSYYHDPFEEMERRMQHGFQEQLRRHPADPGFSSSGSTFYSSTTSTSNRGSNGETVTESVTTRRINGKEQTVKEHIVRKADGTVERHVDTSGDDDFPALDNFIDNRNKNSVPRERMALPQQQQDGQSSSSSNNNRADRPRRWWKKW